MRKRSRTPARIAAVLALVGAIIVLLVIVSSQNGSGSENKDEPAKTERPVESKKRPTKAVYVVKDGDTLLGIAADTGVSIARMEELNPGLDPQRLQAGQRIKLR